MKIAICKLNEQGKIVAMVNATSSEVMNRLFLARAIYLLKGHPLQHGKA